jgi:hypothetical protein
MTEHIVRTIPGEFWRIREAAGKFDEFREFLETLPNLRIPARSRSISVRRVRDHGDYRIEAQLFKNEELLFSHCFATRELAVRWAERERNDIEKSPDSHDWGSY